MKVLTKRVQIGEKEFFIGAKVAEYVNGNSLYLLWSELINRSRVSRIESLVKKQGLG